MSESTFATTRIESSVTTIKDIIGKDSLALAVKVQCGEMDQKRIEIALRTMRQAAADAIEEVTALSDSDVETAHAKYMKQSQRCFDKVTPKP